MVRRKLFTLVKLRRSNHKFKVGIYRQKGRTEFLKSLPRLVSRCNTVLSANDYPTATFLQSANKFFLEIQKLLARRSQVPLDQIDVYPPPGHRFEFVLKKEASVSIQQADTAINKLPAHRLKERIV